MSTRTRNPQVNSLDLEVGDLSQQLQMVLFEQQRKAAVGGATPRATLSTGSAWLIAAPAIGSPGFGLSPAATPARGNARGGDGAAAAADSPAGVISAHLISFGDVAQLQGQNAQLLRTLRALGDEHEAALREKESLTDQAVAAALGEVASLREASEAQKLQLEQLVQQRDMYKELGSGGGSGAPAAAGGAGALTFAGGATAAAATAATEATEAEVEGLKAELARLRQGYADSQEQQAAQTERARAAEHDARVKQAQAEAELSVLHAKVTALSAAEASGGEAASAARRAEVAISAQLLEAQATLKARNDELLAAQADGRRHAAAAELLRQEKGVLSEAQARLARELEGSQESKVELRHLLESLQQMQAGWQQTEAAARAQLLGDKEAADREWFETKVVLARERERGAEARREADQAAAAARQQLQDAQAEAAAALEKVVLALTLLALLTLLLRTCLPTC